MSGSLKKDTRILTEHNSDGTHTSTAATTLKPLLAALITQNVVTGSRAIDSIYQNTTGKVMSVAVSAEDDTSGVQFSAYTDSSATPTTIVTAVKQQAVNMHCHLYFMVLPGNYYKVSKSGGTATLRFWTEWY